MKTYKELVEQAKSEITEINGDQLNNMLLKHLAVKLIDVREPEEYAHGKIAHAINIPRGLLEVEISHVAANKDTPIILYCGGGGRSSLAAKSLQDMGYEQVVSLAGGFKNYKPSNTLK